MKKAKQWLKDNGHIAEVTRGRISLDNHALLTAAYANGTRFSDYEPKETVNKAGEARVKNVAPSAVVGEKVIADITILYPKDSWVAVDSKGIRHTTAICCNEHGYSVCGHPCPGGTLNTLNGTLAFHMEPKG